MTNFCPKCGNKIVDQNIKFCPKCGNNFSNVSNNKKDQTNNEFDTQKIIENEDEEKTNFNKVIQNNQEIEFNIGFKHFIVLFLIILFFYCSYYLYKNKDEFLSKINILFSKDSEQTTIPIKKEDINSDSGKISNELSNVSHNKEINSSTEIDINDNLNTLTGSNNLQINSVENINQLAENFLISHYNSICSHDFYQAYNNYDFSKLIANGNNNPKIKDYNYFQNLWKNTISCKISDFKIISDFVYSYNVVIGYNDGIKETFFTNPMKLSYENNTFKIIEYYSKKK
ncbi:MAG: zinc-ribbon domain-containing protein [Candidatus Gracilibacteria bacterium]|nr:zinc-ribbon domain-containing protein [Candidatus Gracilibacteria bacterium]